MAIVMKHLDQDNADAKEKCWAPSIALADPLEWNWACAAVEGFGVTKGCAEEKLHHLDCEE
jgi:hypothetical protein